MASDAMQPSASMTAATAAGTAADGPPAKKKRGSSGLPRGVSQTGSSKFQGRINYMPPGSRRGQQRGIGTFDTAEEAGLAVAEAEAKLKEQGPEAVWPEPARTNKHKRGEVRPMPNHHQHSSLLKCHLHFPPRASWWRSGGSTSGARDGAALGRVLHREVSQVQLIRRGFCEAWKAQHGAPAGAETDPTFGPMPSTIEEVSNKHMAALLATDGSGEVSQAPIPIAE